MGYNKPELDSWVDLFDGVVCGSHPKTKKERNESHYIAD